MGRNGRFRASVHGPYAAFLVLAEGMRFGCVQDRDKERFEPALGGFAVPGCLHRGQPIRMGGGSGRG